MERVLTDIDADYGGGIERVGHGVLLVFGAPCQLGSLAGQEHGRTIPLADLARFAVRGAGAATYCWPPVRKVLGCRHR